MFTVLNWPHRSEFKGDVDQYTFLLNTIKDIDNKIDEVIREIFGQIGSVLMANGLDKKDHYPKWKRNSKGKIIYSLGLPDFNYPTGPLYNKLKVQYGLIIKEYIETTLALRKVQTEKQKSHPKTYGTAHKIFRVFLH